MKTYNITKGDVIAWEQKDIWSKKMFTSIAVMTDNDEFSVCLNFRGRSDEQDRIWTLDYLNTDGLNIRNADATEIAYLVSELIKQKYSFSYNDGKMDVSLDYLDDLEEDQSSNSSSHSGELLNVSSFDLRVSRFSGYLTELVNAYCEKRNLRGMSYIAKKYRISSITKELFYASHLDEAKKGDTKDNGWLSFCSDMYVFVLDREGKSTLPIFTNYKKR